MTSMQIHAVTKGGPILYTTRTLNSLHVCGIASFSLSPFLSIGDLALKPKKHRWVLNLTSNFITSLSDLYHSLSIYFLINML